MKMMMRKLGSAALAALALGAAWLTPAEAASKPKTTTKTSKQAANDGQKTEALAKKLDIAYRPEVDTDLMSYQRKKDLQSAVSYLKSLPKSQRWSFIAERMGLLFMPQDGDMGYSPSGWLRDDSHFIGANGVEYDAMKELYAVNNKGNRAEWDKYSEITDELGRELVFSQLPNEVAELILQNAKYQLNKMKEEQPERRDMCLAHLAQLCYLPNGKSPYNVANAGSWDWRPQHSIQMYAIENKGCKFIDTEGVERSYDAVHKKYHSPGNARWSILSICVHHLGADAILALYPKELKRLRHLAEQKRKGAYTPRVTTDADMAAIAPVTKPNTAAAATLRTWPQRTREAWIAGRQFLTFMPDGSNPRDHRGWTRTGAHFIGTDGQEYDWQQSICYPTNSAEWAQPGVLMKKEGDGVWIDLREEVERLKKMYIEHAPTIVR